MKWSRYELSGKTCEFGEGCEKKATFETREHGYSTYACLDCMISQYEYDVQSATDTLEELKDERDQMRKDNPPPVGQEKK